VGSTAISASEDSSNKRAVAIIGDSNGYTGSTTVTLSGLSSVPWLASGGQINVTVERIPDQAPLSAPQVVFNQNLSTSGGSVNIPVTFQDAHDAFAVYATPASSVVSLRAHANGDYVTASSGASPLIAGSTSVGTSEEFDRVDLGSGDIALRAHANGEYVTAEDAGASALVANRASIGPWETFQLVSNSDGSISLKAHANGEYVTAENAGASALIANRTSIGPWEQFDLITD
jgi:hypothetical protein